MTAKRREEAVDEAPDDVQDDVGEESGAGSDAEPRGRQPEGEPGDDQDAAAALAEAEAKAAENWDRYLRAAAELENVRKRASRDVENAHKFALERFGRELLTIRDSLEMGLAAADNATIESLIEGKEATLKQLTTVLEQFGIVEVDPAGEPFDPELHEAISV